MNIPPLAKQLTVIILALVGLADAHWGLEILGHLTSEVVTIVITLALAAFGIVEMQARKLPVH